MSASAGRSNHPNPVDAIRSFNLVTRIHPGHLASLMLRSKRREPGRLAMGIRTAVAAGAALLMSGLAAQALESTAKAQSKLSADALWAKVGDFCGISKWHPAFEKCELSADGKTRTLFLRGGGTILEALVKMDPAARSYTYSIVSGPLPVANYDAKGASDADALKAIDGAYESGLKALTAN